MAGMRYQPQGRARINRGHPLARGMLFASTASGSIDLVSNRLRSTSGAGGFTTAAGRFGLARTFNRSSAAQDSYPVSGFNGDFTVVLVGGITGGIASSQIVLAGCAGTNARWFVGENSNSRLSFVTQPSGGSSVTATDSGPSGDYVYVARLSGTTMTLFRDGVQIGTATQSSSAFSDIDNITVGSTVFLSNPSANVYFAAYIRRAWSDTEVAQFSANPWQVFEDTTNSDNVEFDSLPVYVDRRDSHTGARRQPRGPLRLDGASGLASGLVSLVWGGQGVYQDLINPTIPFTASGVSQSATRRGGIGVRATTAGAGAGVAGPRNSYGKAKLTNAPLTILVVGGNFAPTSSGSSWTLGCVGYPNYGGYGIMQNFGNRSGAVNIGGTMYILTDATPWSESGTYALTVDAANNMRLFDGGTQVLSRATTTGSINYDSFGTVSLLGNNPNDQVPAGSGTVQFMAVWNRVLSDAELRALADNPWQVFVAEEDDIDLIAAAGNVLNALIGETLTAVEAQSALMFIAAVSSDPNSVADTISALAAMVSAANEAGSAIEVTAASSNRTASLSDAGSASESESAQAVYTPLTAESLAAVENGTSVMTTNQSASDTVSAADLNASSSFKFINADVSDSAAGAVEVVSSQAAVVTNCAELTNVAELTAASSFYAAVWSEQVTAADNWNVTTSYGVGAFEVSAVVDAVTGGVSSEAALVDYLSLFEELVNIDHIILPRTYPLSGVKMHFPLEGLKQHYPLEGK